MANMSEKELKAALEAAVSGSKVWDIERPYPVSARGSVDGIGFYFRARDAHWYLAFAEKHGESPISVAVGKADGWKHEEEYESADHDAGDMPAADVIACITKAVGLWRARTKALANPYPKPESCGDGGCVIWPASGMHTNGGCRCQLDRFKLMKALAWYRWEYERRGTT